MALGRRGRAWSHRQGADPAQPGNRRYLGTARRRRGQAAMTTGPLCAPPDALPRLTVRAVQTIAVTVPMRFALGTSAATLSEAPLLLIDLLTEEGVTGRSYLFTYRPSGSIAIAAVLREALGLIAGDRLAPVEIAAKLERRFALIGVTGVVRM